ncbi:MAG: TPR repeat protein [bacterium]|jgi:TPR repeat protein
MKTIFRLLAIPILLICFATFALADTSRALKKKTQLAYSKQRVALIIGNGNYKSSPLKNALNDANDMAKSLRKLGFTVMLHIDANRKQMRHAIRTFGKKIHGGGVGLFFYAGHGMQVKGKNYLIPIGADIQDQNEVLDEGIDAGLVLRKMESAQNRLNIVFLDACRNNPFAKSFRSGQKGLAQMDAPKGSLIAYATAPGSVAADGSGRNGVFTKHILKSLQTPNLELSQMMKKVRLGVLKETSEKQIPWDSSSLVHDFYFQRTSAITTNQQQGSQSNQLNADEEMWRLVKTTEKIAELQKYLTAFPTGKFRIHAELKVSRLQDQQKKNKPAQLFSNLNTQDRESHGRNDSRYEKFGRDQKENKWDRNNSSSQGNRNSYYQKGYNYEFGFRTTQNYQKAIRWYKKAAELGHNKAQYSLGVIYQYKLGYQQKDYTSAASWYRKSAVQGNKEAQYNIGFLYEIGKGVGKSQYTAFTWYKKAAQQGLRKAQSKVAFMYKYGRGITRNKYQALQWYLKAANQGDIYTQNIVAQMYERGEGTSINHSSAFYWYKKSAKNKYSVAQHNLARMYESGKGIKANYNKALRWYKKAARQKNVASIHKIGTMYEYGFGVNRSYLDAQYWYKKSSKLGYSSSKLALVRLKSKEQAKNRNNRRSRDNYQQRDQRGRDDYNQRGQRGRNNANQRNQRGRDSW